jgi:hypothetical protein
VGRDVFISYADEDRAVATLACKRLEDLGVSCWMAPRDVLPGRTWATSIIDAIESCRAIVLVLSASSAGSRQVAREVERGDALTLPLLTIRVDGTELSGDLEYFLSNTQWLDVSREHLEEHLAPLPRYVRLLLAQRHGPAAQVQKLAPTDKTKGEIHAVVTSWLAVLARGYEATTTRAVEGPQTLMFAVRFAVYMVIAGAVISFPVSQAARSRPAAFLVAYMVSSFVEIVGVGLIVHSAFRLVGGTSPLTSSMIAWCLYMAYWPVFVVSLAPVNASLAGALQGDPVAGLEHLAAGMSAVDALVVCVSFVASTAALVRLTRDSWRTF